MLIRPATTLLQGRCYSFTLGSSSLTWLCGVPSALFILLCLPSGCGHPFGSLVSFVTIDRQRRFPLEGFFVWVVASHFGVVSSFSLRPLSVCHGSRWLVPAFFPSLSLSFPVCAHFQLAGIFFCFLTALHPTSGSWFAGSCGFSSPLGLPTFAMGSPLRGRGLLVLDQNEGSVSPFGSGTLVSSWLDIPPLSAGICAPCQSGLCPLSRCPSLSFVHPWS